MQPSQPTYVACDGGLNLAQDKFTLMRRPGVARILENFESSTGGGYRRINGFSKFGGVSSTQPDSTNPILGIHPYALGVVVVVNDGVHYSEDGITWTQINRDTSEAGSDITQLALDTELVRASQEQAEFALVLGEEGHTTNPYGTLYIAAGGGEKLVHFHIDGTGGSRTYHFVELTTPSSADLVEIHDHHLCVVDKTNAPNTVYYSDTDDFDDFIGAGAGSVTLPDHVVAIKSFRDNLIIFCRNSIHKLININDATNIAVEPITQNIGCLAAQSVQEIGGDLIFLAPDGFRNLAATERIGDVDISAVSNTIQPLLEEIIGSLSAYTVTSTVIRKKSQYRFCYLDSAGTGCGIIGTLKQNAEGQLGFQWSQTKGIPVQSISSFYDDDGVEVIYHGGYNGYAYLHDTGNDFDGSAIEAIYKGPDTDLGDLGLRKTMHYMKTSIENEGSASITLEIRFDFSSALVPQPSPYTITLGASGEVYGTATYGTSVYGSAETPLDRIPLQGSGHTVSYRFTSNDTNAPYTIHGYHTEVMPSARK